MKRLTALALLFGCLVKAGPAHAQNPLERPVPLPALGRSLATNSDTTAMVHNPANIAFLPGPELRWSGYFLNDSALSSNQGHAIAFALPLGFIPVSTGVRLDLVSPDAGPSARISGAGLSYQWFTWDIAFGNDAAAIGVSFQRSYSNQTAVHGFGTWSTGLTLRPLDYFGLAGAIRQVDAPTSESGVRLGTTYDVGVTIRPTGNDLVELSAEAAYVDERGGYWLPRAVLDIGIPDLGHLRGDLTWVDPGEQLGPASWTMSTSLVVSGNSRHASGELSLGARYGNALGNAASDRFYENLHAEAAFRGFRESKAAEGQGYAVRVRLENTPSVRQHTRLLRDLWSLAEERRLRAVLLEVRANPARSLAYLEELIDAIYHLRRQGIQVLCHLEDATGSGMFLCGAADRTLINPGGGIRYTGLKSQSYYLEGLFSKLGISADFVRIGAHKSAPESLALSRASETALADRTRLIQEVELELSSAFARARGTTIEDVRRAARTGPFTALEAKRAGLVDGFAFDDKLPEKVADLVGERLPVDEGRKAVERSDRMGPEKRVAIVYVEGDMVDGRSQSFPFIGIKTAGSYTIADSLKEVREDRSIGAVVLRVETGGGSAMASDVMWREIQLTAAKKPVVVSMGGAAASGGYYIASAGNYIYANPLTVTGSIGIFFGKVEVSGLLRKIGVNVETLKTTQMADSEAIFRPYTDEERETLKRKIEQVYGMFLRRVSDGRKLSPTQVDQVGRGQIWTGREALGHGLVDDLGGLRQALAKARVLGDVPDNAPIVELPVPEGTLLGKLLGIEGLKKDLAGADLELPEQLKRVLVDVAPLTLYDADTPLARIEITPELIP
jgi:protease-4